MVILSLLLVLASPLFPPTVSILWGFGQSLLFCRSPPQTSGRLDLAPYGLPAPHQDGSLAPPPLHAFISVLSRWESWFRVYYHFFFLSYLWKKKLCYLTTYLHNRGLIKELLRNICSDFLSCYTLTAIVCCGYKHEYLWGKHWVIFGQMDTFPWWHHWKEAETLSLLGAAKKYESHV